MHEGNVNRRSKGEAPILTLALPYACSYEHEKNRKCYIFRKENHTLNSAVFLSKES
jgi:hypothetical protein